MQMFPAQSTVELFPCPLQGEISTAIACDKQGRVKALSSIWPARFHPSNTEALALPGASVTVIGREGITLLVEPMVVPAPLLTNSHRCADVEVN